MIKEYLELGRIVGTHGVRGEMRVNPSCDSPDFAKQFPVVYFDSMGATCKKVVSCRPHGNIFLLKIEGIESIEAAEKLRNTVIYIKRSDAKLKEGTWFIEELLSCTVKDASSGIVYGTLSDIEQYPANDVWTVKDDSGREYLLPAIKSVIKSVDVQAGVIEITPMKGIFEDAD